MKIFGKGLGEYFAFTKWLIVFVFVVGIVRLALSLGGVPNSTGKWASVTVAFLIGVLCFSVRVHTSGFGSYKQLLPPIWILSVATQAFVAVAIVLAIVTDKSNIFTAPEYSNGGDGRNWVHAGAHLALGATLAPLVGWLIGSLVMMVTKLVVPGKGAPAAGA
jgi:hypothetical protein